MGSFGEWEVPLYYSSVLEEHEAVRAGVGIFDISHMGEIYFEGPAAFRALDFLITNQLQKLTIGKALYSPICNDRGGIVDDLVIYRLSADVYLVIVNASNVAKDYDWFLHHNIEKAQITDRTEKTGLLSVQGPKSLELLKTIFSEPIERLSYYSIMEAPSLSSNALVARTGYTGELGFEILIRTEDLENTYQVIMEKGKKFGIKPIGFGARDTLRLEACMLLYGQDMDDEITPLEAGLERTISFEKEFLGRFSLLEAKERGIQKKLVGFEMIGHGLARHGYPILKNGHSIGQVTSGSFSPTTKKNIGLAYVSTKESEIGNEIDIQIRSNMVRAKIVKTPFYKKPK